MSYSPVGDADNPKALITVLLCINNSKKPQLLNLIINFHLKRHEFPIC